MAKFPYGRSAQDDIADLWRLERRRAGARGAGLTSISPGEGSLDLLGPNGQPVARYGDMPGPKFGIGLPHEGDWVTVQEYTGIRLVPLTARMGQAEDRLDSHDGRLDTHGEHLGLHDTQISSIKGRVDGHDGDIDAIEDLLSDLSGQVGDLAGDTGSAQTTIDELVDAVSTLAGNLAIASTRILVLSAVVKNLADRVDALDGDTTSPTPPVWA